ncbi:MAG: hypothetical protein JSR59_21280 [Proteobacteria bacterium]|nr:hypothetical protein [Pseudomonadota bacterium]
MLTSLFGDLSAFGVRGPGQGDNGFAATAILESVATEVNAQGRMVDRHSHDLVVSGSPAQAIRDHFAATRADLDTASSLITLLDPTGVWASAVIKALSDASGRPIERLHLREHGTLRTLALIERTTLVRRHDDALRIYHADVRAPGAENAEIPVALMERSQMTTVVVGPMQPHAIDALLLALRAAASLPTWRCRHLLFMLPPNAVWITNKVHAIGWPSHLAVRVLSESMTSASSVWNAMLDQWTQARAEPDADSASDDAVASAASTLDPQRARQALATLLTLDGLLGCTIVDASNGQALAREVREDQPIDIERAAAGGAQLLRLHRQTARQTGLADQVDEVITSAGNRLQILRAPARHPGVFVLALLDKQRTNLALARLHLGEVERALG